MQLKMGKTKQGINGVIEKATSLQKNGNYLNAAKAYLVAFVNTNNWRFANEAGLCFQQASCLLDATDAFKKALSIAPDRNFILFNIGLNYIITGQYELAKEALQEVLRETFNPKAAFELGWIAMQQQDWDNAIEYFDIAIINDQALNNFNITSSTSLDPLMASSVYLNKARIYGLELHRYDEACKMLSNLKEVANDKRRIFTFAKEAMHKEKIEIAKFATTLILEDYHEFNQVRELCDELCIIPDSLSMK